jgi:hypothetical protein
MRSAAARWSTHAASRWETIEGPDDRHPARCDRLRDDGDHFGRGDALVAVPWDALSHDPERHRFVLEDAVRYR